MARLMTEEDINLVTMGAVLSAMEKGECWEQSIEMLDRLPQKTKAGFFSGSHLWEVSANSLKLQLENRSFTELNLKKSG